jgi:hypothetical protein
MLSTILPPILIGTALLLVGFLAQSRLASEGDFRHWLTQCLSAAFYCAGFFFISAASYIWLAVTNHWDQPHNGELTFAVLVLPLTMSFITTFLVDIRYRDFGASITAIAIGSVSGLVATSMIGSFFQV